LVCAATSATSLKRHFARQNNLRETGIFEEFHLGRVAVVGLRAGVQLDRRQIHFEQAHVLDDQRIGAGFVQLPGQLASFLEFVIAQDGIQGDENLGVVAVGKGTQAGDFGDVVAGAVAGPEGRAANIDGIGAMLDGFDAEIGILGRGEEFEGVIGAGHGALVRKTRGKFFNIEFAQDGFSAFAGNLLRSTAFCA
jgi:hypothetical protein